MSAHEISNVDNNYCVSMIFPNNHTINNREWWWDCGTDSELRN